jgi:hypothetical protein
MAEDILAALYLMDRFSDREPSFKELSMRKTVFAAQEIAQRIRTADGTPMKFSDKRIDRY